MCLKHVDFVETVFLYVARVCFLRSLCVDGMTNASNEWRLMVDVITIMIACESLINVVVDVI